MRQDSQVPTNPDSVDLIDLHNGFETAVPSPPLSRHDPSTYPDQSESFSVGEAALNLDFFEGLPAWLEDYTFDFANMNSSFANNISNSGTNWIDTPCEPPISHNVPVVSIGNVWFTRVPRQPEDGRPRSRSVTPPHGDSIQEVDESYRRTLHTTLRARTIEPFVPSSEYLNLCVRCYFTRFHGVFPVVHAPTFRASKSNSMLLISICSVGSLFTGSDSGATQGAQIWACLNKATLANWERLVLFDNKSSVSMLQAILIGQTFAMLSGDPKHLATAESFHGGLLAWMRRSRMFQRKHDPLPSSDISEGDAEARWRDWAREEEIARLVLGLYIHDAELARIFHHEPFLRHSAQSALATAPESLFAARNSLEWLPQLRSAGDAGCISRESSTAIFNQLASAVGDNRRTDRFTQYAQIEGISATIIEERLAGCLDDHKQEYLGAALIKVYQQHLLPPEARSPDPLSLDILWHLTFISLFTDFDLLERAIGRDRQAVTPADEEEVTSWAASTNSRRAIMHIHLILKQVEKFPLGVEPAMHVPRAIFTVAITWFCAIHYNRNPSTVHSAELDFPEIQLLGLNPGVLLSEALGDKHTRPTASKAKEKLCRFADLLQRLGHWGIARKFAAIIEVLIQQGFG